MSIEDEKWNVDNEVGCAERKLHERIASCKSQPPRGTHNVAGKRIQMNEKSKLSKWMKNNQNVLSRRHFGKLFISFKFCANGTSLKIFDSSFLHEWQKDRRKYYCQEQRVSRRSGRMFRKLLLSSSRSRIERLVCLVNTALNIQIKWIFIATTVCVCL